ncbi:hypothetical protein LIER_32816 [Lithospermum erythrorhizon]|uniref:Uncharacterized protein n=1 Tax=Lithospermum erythrorhizon TaxID=34254 RepID=A0AAV3RWP3_LITER
MQGIFMLYDLLCCFGSFDILRDDFGLLRSEFPHTMFCVAGTQAMEASSNYIEIFKLSNISGKTSGVRPANNDPDTEGHSSDIDDNDEEEGGPGAPILQLRKVFHAGGVNRIRAMSQNPHICASWADTGYFQVWDLSAHLNALAESTAAVSNGAIAASNQAPLVKFKHEDEGYALDWSPLVPGRLVSGDCKSFIHLWEPTAGTTWNVDSNPFVGHKARVKDLQWSPTLPSVFASCSADGSVLIWDTRSGKSPPAIIMSHDADEVDEAPGVNVISWNRLASQMLAAGRDDGSFSIWDLRQHTDMLAHFEYHKHPITSIEWSPHENSKFAVSSSDNQLTIWDMLSPIHEEEESEFGSITDDEMDAPPYVHRGQKDLKELHWHSQIPGMVISTEKDGFNVIIPTQT